MEVYFPSNPHMYFMRLGRKLQQIKSIDGEILIKNTDTVHKIIEDKFSYNIFYSYNLQLTMKNCKFEKN